ncbi:MAG: FIG001353: Acetyltransferase [uncultured Sulfurovum sp.]|uniref:FIG001353: Acetyltransferase n=1 Tax=uncultured Sulfurovum sp. TaxID=269237 RepID=A0A6S6T687_9BACT|nr:MAG: FIG001353: Acetyltransferase [uncultured Sulfurovum sp.]
MISVPLDKKRHDRKRFDCAVPALKNYLQMMANQQSNKDNTRTFVLEDVKNPNFIIGYYTLTMSTLDLSSLPSALQKKHQNANSAGLIARLAVDKRYKKEGFGEWLLIDALKKLLNTSDSVAFPLIVVDAKDGASDFYKKFGFVAFFDEENKLFITVESVRKSFKVSSEHF